MQTYTHLDYTFDASAKQVTLNGFSGSIEQVKLIVNISNTARPTIYYPLDSQKGAVLVGDVLTLNYNTTNMSDTDILEIIIDSITITVINENLDIPLSDVLAELELKANLSETQPVSLASVPLPTGAGTEATLIQIRDYLDTVETKLTAPLTTKETRSATPSQSSVSVTNSNTSILASNANRLGATIYNEGGAICYMKLGATASTTSYTLQIASGGYYEVPFNYTGAIDGITSASTAQLRITELT